MEESSQEPPVPEAESAEDGERASAGPQGPAGGDAGAGQESVPGDAHRPEGTLPPPAVELAVAAAAAVVFAGGLAAGSAQLLGSWYAVPLASAVAGAAIAVWHLHRSDALRETLRYRPGDVLRATAIGAMTFAACYALARGLVPAVPALARDLRALLAPRAGGAPWLAIALVLACGEALIFRALVQRAVAARAGAVRGVAVAALVQALAWLPAGHPTLALLALVIGLGAGIVQARFDRTLPALLAHLVVVYLLSLFPPLAAG